MRHEINESEALFARLCSDTYYGGFVYRNPSFLDPTEKEAGDVILWVRDWLVIIEVVWRSTNAGVDTKSFVKRIGEKRDQLLADFDMYANGDLNIYMQNEYGEGTEYDYDYFNEDTTRGVVLIDAPALQGKLHFETLRLTLEAPHPIAIMTRSDFESILAEADTPADLGFYLGDRHRFLQDVYKDDPNHFLQLGQRMEQELMGLYKLGENKFDLDRWRASVDKRFWHRYQIERCEDIAKRDADNANSEFLDSLASRIRASHGAGGFTLQHAWELALRTRRERAFISNRIQKKINALLDTGRDQKFATEHEGTGCWDVFYFHQGVDSVHFRAETQRMTDFKMWVERAESDFKHSVFCFGFRSSPIDAGGLAEVILTVSDAWKWPDVSSTMLSEAHKYFRGRTHTSPIKEFPNA
jgi:hypothetical protein